MSDRFFSSARIESRRVQLEGAEAHHLAHVMRISTGAEVTLFDGSGYEFPAVVENLDRRSVTLRVLDQVNIDRELPHRITVGAALPKGDRQKWMIEKLVELGVSCFVPLETIRSSVHPTPNTIDKLQRAVIEASKQCGRNRLMQIAPPTDVDPFLASRADDEDRWIAHPGASSEGHDEAAEGRFPLARINRPQRFVVGPEGGFDPQEVRRADELDWRRVDLGPRIMRVETAAIALTTLAAQMMAGKH